MAWYNASWLYRVKVTTLATKVDADLTDYPVYVNLANLPAGFHTNVNQTDGRDIRVTTSDGTTEVPREVVFYTAASDTGELHFKGTVNGTTDTDFYIYYGNAAATEPAASATYGKNNVWDTNYKGVWHLNEASGSLTDSTSNAANGTAQAGITQNATGKVAAAVSSAGASNGYVSVPDANNWTPAGDFTLECWVNFSSLANTNWWETAFIGHDVGGGNNNKWMFSYDPGTTKGTLMHLNTGAGGGPEIRGSVWTASTSTWYHIWVTRTGTSWAFYRNGATDGTATNSTAMPNSAIEMHFGHAEGAATLNGKLDEIRFSHVARAGTWISTQYNNQNSPSTFYTVGAQEVGQEPINDSFFMMF